MSSPHLADHLDSSLLELYLNDHLAGAAAGRRRIQNMVDTHSDLPGAAELTPIAEQISSEYDRVAELITQLGLRRLRYRQAASAVGEMLGRAKLNRRLTQRSPMTPLLEIEFMRGAVAAKQGLWDLMAHLAPELGLDPAEFTDRSRTAQEQLTALTRIHGQYAPGTFRSDVAKP